MLAIASNPQIVILDEPTTGLDPQARRNMWEIIRQIRDEGRTVLLTTHYMEEAQELCHRIGIINNGQLIALDTPGGLVNSLHADSQITVTAQMPLERVKALPGVTAAHYDGTRLVMQSNDTHEICARPADASRRTQTDANRSQYQATRPGGRVYLDDRPKDRHRGQLEVGSRRHKKENKEVATNITAIETTRPSNASLRRFALMLKANALMYVRDKTTMFWNIVFPMGLMFLFGAIYGGQKLNPSDPNSATAIVFLVPGLIVLGLMSNGLIGNATAMSNYREQGILRRIQTTPMPLWQLMLARILNQSVILIVQSMLMLGISILVFNARYDAMGVLAAIPIIVLGAIMFMALGQAVSSLVRKWDSALIVAQVINFPLMFFGGLWIPLSSLPGWLQQVSKYLPSSMMADLTRGSMLSDWHMESNLPFAVDFAGVLIYFLAAVIISARFFKWS